jgi:hypothetical protein
MILPSAKSGVSPNISTIKKSGKIVHILLYNLQDLDSSVGIATRYGLEGPGIKFRWGAGFSAPFQNSPVAHPASCTLGTGCFPCVKLPGSSDGNPFPCSDDVKERVRLYIYSPSGPSWPVLGWTSPYHCILWSLLQCYSVSFGKKL